MALLHIAPAANPRLPGLALPLQRARPEQAQRLLAGGHFRLAIIELADDHPQLLPLCAAPRGATALLVLGTQRRVACLRAGADLCLPQDVTGRELHARVQALLRRQSATPPDDGAWLSLGLPMLGLGARQVALSRDEQRLLEVLARHGGVVPRAVLEELLWGEVQEAGAARLNRLAGATRRKLVQLGLPDELQAVRGLGYRLGMALELRA
ncbi:winged helix-turn-helix domain-containing protein [Pseudomonas citronellolis]|uniref:winged helix-turn-helix domain-containing protein n=1 Tax=Pseudomonas citronellolis TaxID=53408 RepID=UPI0023E3F56D|nr:winged helix-turn-helix domain-containing protein [Pseudomonas citronellolis]MDF3932553.1 winged helix-turn-helix domain-containing protein [Pseudomonas citronellolis]